MLLNALERFAFSFYAPGLRGIRFQSCAEDTRSESYTKKPVCAALAQQTALLSDLQLSNT